MRLKRFLGLSVVGILTLTAACGGGEPAGETPEGEAPMEGEAPQGELFQVDPATAATLTGSVKFEGTAPAAVRINMSAEPDCAKLHGGPVMAEAVEVNDNATLRNVFVWVKGGLEGKRFPVSTDPVELDQKGCIYHPHVIALQANQPFKVANNDPTTHNVHPLPKVNREWNKSQTANASAVEAKFPRQEIMIAVKCNIHPWMRSYINVVDHPFFAVTGEDGSFEIKGLPPGTYTVEAIHEKLGSKEMSVTLGDADSKAADFSFSAS